MARLNNVQLAARQAMTTGTITTATSAVTASDLVGVGAATISVYGTYAGVNFVVEGYDGTNWYILAFRPASNNANPAPVLATGVITANSTVLYEVPLVLGVQQVRVRATAWTSGTANIIIEPSAQFAPLFTTVNGTVTATLASTTLTAVTPGAAATNLGKAEDAVAATGDIGVAVWGVRRDAAAVPTSATGDYSEIRLDQYGQVATVPGVSGTDTVTGVASSATSVTLLAANTSRKGATFSNVSTATLYLQFGATASNASGGNVIAIAPNGYYELPSPVRQGIITGIWSAANGYVNISESI
jgi:hypothetical protein